MKIVREHITRFERPSSEEDFKRKVGIGRIYQIKKWFSDLGISSDRYTIDKDFNINIKGSLDLRNTDITSLPDNLSIGGSLHLSETKITSLPNDLSVGSSLWLREIKITSLPNNLSVGEYIWLDKDKKGKVYVPKHLKEKVKYV